MSLIISQTPSYIKSPLSLSLSLSQMENKLKLRISRMFRASFGSCRSRNISDVMQKAVFAPQKHQNTEPLLSPKPRPFPSICKPRCQIDNNFNTSAPRRKVSKQCSPFIATNGGICPPASPISPWNQKTEYCGFYEKKKRNPAKSKKKKRTHLRKSKIRDNTNMFLLSSSSQDSFNNGWWWWSSDDEKEDETETLFSSKQSLSSDSSELKQRTRRGGQRRSDDNKQMGVLPLSEGKVKDSFAVVKSSRDPYNDFRTSMVEMIIEKQIFSAKELEQLLQCFLSLNSYRHHRIILEVFMEIYEALFSDWC